MRENFEKFAVDKGWNLQRFKEGRFPGEYCDGSVQDSWLSWQAAERDTRERCAQQGRSLLELVLDVTLQVSSKKNEILDTFERRIRGKE